MEHSGTLASRSLIGIQPDEVDIVWPLFWSFIQKSAKYARIAPLEEQKTKLSLKNCESQGFFIECDGEVVCAVLTCIYDDLNGKSLEITSIGGKHYEKWLHLLDDVVKWGKDMGCQRVILTGREGWLKVLKGKGFEKTAIVLERVI